jgi:flagellar basal-body rod protein FlgC
MSLFKVMDIAGTAMSAQSVRLNTVASNLANADSISSSANQTYKARKPVFATMLEEAQTASSSTMNGAAGVKIAGIMESAAPALKEYSPNHPLADENGYIYRPNVNVVEEMADMMSASRSYQTNVQIAEVAKTLLSLTLRMGKN